MQLSKKYATVINTASKKSNLQLLSQLSKKYATVIDTA